MNLQHEFLAEIVTRMEAAGLEYMICGSVASSLYGQPRATNDVDAVIAPDAEAIERFCDSLPDSFYVSAAAVKEALRRRSMFNVIDIEGGWKIDLVVRKDRPFSVEEFARRRRLSLLGTQAFLASAEDTILAKLEWRRESQSERQWNDALQVATMSGAALDEDYLRRWAADLELSEDLDQLLREARA